MRAFLKIGVIAFLVVHLTASVVCADWRFYRRLQVRSQEKHIFRLDRRDEGPVRAWLILRRRVENVFASRLPVYKVDDGRVQALDEVEPKRVRKNRWVRWHICEGDEAPGARLREIMNGERIVFQYYLPDGVIKEAAFPLEGAREAIQKLLK